MTTAGEIALLALGTGDAFSATRYGACRSI